MQLFKNAKCPVETDKLSLKYESKPLVCSILQKSHLVDSVNGLFITIILSLPCCDPYSILLLFSVSTLFFSSDTKNDAARVTVETYTSMLNFMVHELIWKKISKKRLGQI